MVMLGVHLLLAITWKATTWPFGFDARSYFAAAQALAEGRLPVNIDHPELLGWGSTNDTPPYLYPPLLALVLVPFTLVPSGVAHALWFAIIVATTVCLVPLLRPFVGWRVAVVGVMCFAPTWYSGWMGQINALIAVLYALALHGARREGWARCATWLVLGAQLKIVPVLSLLVLVAQRRWRGVVVAGLGGALIVALSLLSVRPDAWYHGLLAANVVRWSFRSSFSWTGQALYWLREPGVLVGDAITALFLVATLARLPKLPPTLALAATMILPLLIARITWDHHAMMALPALAVLWQWSTRGRFLAASTWLLLSTINDITMPIMLTLCWTACCSPHLLEDATANAQPVPPQPVL
jgi:hypothetical protein